MPHEIPTNEPVTLTAGANWEWDRTLADFPPSDGWALSYVLRGPTDLEIGANAAGQVYQVREGAAATSTVGEGAYRLVGYVERGTDRHIVYDARLEVERSPLTAVNAKSHAEQEVETLRARILARQSADESSWTQGQRAAHREELRELRRQLAMAEYRVALEKDPTATISHEVTFVAAR